VPQGIIHTNPDKLFLKTKMTHIAMTLQRQPRRRLLISAALGATLLTSFTTSVIAAEKTLQPKLVVVMVVDGLPQEQLQRYRNQFGQGGFRRLLDQGAWYGNAHQAHGVTVTAVGHAAILTGAYPSQHGIINNGWIDPRTLASVYCTEDPAHSYLGEITQAGDGTSPANLRVTTVGDELRYATGNRAKVITVSGKDRGAILLAGKTGTAYMYMKSSGNFASSTYYMQSYPAWQQRYQATKPQDRFYGARWQPLLPATAYTDDAADELIAPTELGEHNRFPFIYSSKSGKPDAQYYEQLMTGPFVDEMTLDFARAAIDGEQLGRNPTGVTDLLGISLSSHDYVNHSFGPESSMSHDHLQRLDRLLAKFFNDLDQRVGLNNTLIVLTADHGFPNVPEFAQANKLDAQRLKSKPMMAALNQHLAEKFGLDNIAYRWSAPNVLLDYKAMEQKSLPREAVETAAARFLLNYPGIANAYTRTQLEHGALPDDRIGRLMQRAWNRQLSGDIMLVTKPFWHFSNGEHGTTHGSPYNYDTNVPLMIMGKPWIKPGAYGQYAEVVDIAPTLAKLLKVRPPAASEGRVLTESLR
jgi:predicted AlkP superfamily pyrophosphatase or phosphodiesterase